MPTTPIGGLRYPALSDNPNGPLAVQNLADDVADQLPGLRYANDAARDAEITSPDDGMTVWLDTPGAYFDRIDGAWVQRTNNGGTSGVLAGTAPPAGTPLITKTHYGSVVHNAFGDGTITFPGGAFPNGLLAVNLIHYSPGSAPSNDLEFVPWGATLSAVNSRCYSPGGAVFGGTGVALICTAIGW